MNIETLREYCLSKPEAEETFPFGPNVIVFRIRHKIFLLSPLDGDDLRFNVKCNPELAVELRDRHTCVLPGFHMNKKHWNTVVADGSVSFELIKEWIDHSYDLVRGGGRKS